jgi:Protein of unknown function (DUF2985)
MLFLLICNAAPAMCTPTCNDINSPRRIWIEIDSQILNALFCVTGIGLLPWRARDGYVLYKKNWAKLSKIHAGWYIHGVTRRALMYWVVILFLANSGWQIAVPFPYIFRRLIRQDGMLHVDDESIHSTVLVYRDHYQRRIHVCDCGRRYRILGSTTTEKIAKAGENGTSGTNLGEEH